MLLLSLLRGLAAAPAQACLPLRSTRLLRLTQREGGSLRQVQFDRGARLGSSFRPEQGLKEGRRAVACRRKGGEPGKVKNAARGSGKTGLLCVELDAVN